MKVDAIGKKEKQGKEFSFANRNREPFEWTNEVPIHDLSFQGLMELEAQFPDLPSELP